MKKLPRIDIECPCCGKIYQLTEPALARKKGLGCSMTCSRKLKPTKHGHASRSTRSSTYSTWNGMKNRCNVESNFKYPAYGAKGIKICDRWNDFANFLSDMGEKPEGMTLDRIDGTKGYSPENCRWATPYQQSHNIKTNKYLTINGISKQISEWSEESGISKFVIAYRYKAGWPHDKMFSTIWGGNRIKQSSLSISTLN
jgi:hypothetical protein